MLGEALFYIGDHRSHVSATDENSDRHGSPP
jgi:hypothetical protein